MTITVEKLYSGSAYACKIYLGKCSLRQYDDVITWINEQNIPCTWTSDWAVCMSDKNAQWLVLRWA